MDYLIPVIGSIGQFRLKEPIADYLNPDTNYKVLSVRSIKEMVASNEDVLNDIYLKLGLTQEDYEYAVNNDIPIVTLLSPDGQYLYIPVNYLKSIPDVTGKAFRKKTIAVDLGVVPDDQDFNFLLEEISDLVKAYYGIEPEVLLLNTSNTLLYTVDEYNTFESNRKAKIVNNKPCRLIVKDLEKLVKEMKTKIETLVKKLDQ